MIMHKQQPSDFIDSDDERDKNAELFSSIRNGNVQKFHELLKAGVKVNIIDKNNKDNTLLHYAVEKDQKEIAKMLMQDWKIDIDAKNNQGNTALHIAVSKGNKELVQVLLSKNAKTDIKNNKNRNSFDIAKNLAKQDIVQILESHIQLQQVSVKEKYQHVKPCGKRLEYRVDQALHHLSQNVNQLSAVEKQIQSQKRNANIDSESSQRNPNSLHGNLFHLKLLMLFLFRGVCNEYSFRLGKEIREAKKFDDLVFEIATAGKKQYRFLQSKHKVDESEQISADNLLTESAGDFSLTKYFFSYQDSKKEDLFKDGVIKHLIICTNIDFDYKSLEMAQIRVEEINSSDDILCKSGRKQSMRYKFNKEVISLLEPKLQNYNLNRLARRLAECFLRNNPIKHHDVNDIFVSYHLILAEEVININTKKFHDKFIKDEDISEDAKKFRKVFIEEILKKSEESKALLTLKDINKAIVNKREIIPNKTVGLALSRNFGKGEAKGWPKKVILYNEIQDFLNCLIFAVNQPNQDELGKIIKLEIGKELDLDSITTDNTYNKLLVTISDWLQGKGRRFLTYVEGKEFFEEAIRGIPIWFDMSEPVQSFTGRDEQLRKLHIALSNRGEQETPQIASIVGLAGVGKSELARKYAYIYKDDYDGNVIWLNAESYQTLAKSFCRLAKDKLGISLQNKSGNKSIKSIVEDVYQVISKRKSLFIFDNAEKYRAEDEGDNGISKFLPSVPSNANKLYILITSCNQKWGPIKVIQLGTFTKEEAANFITKALNIQDDTQKSEIQKLMKILGWFPLALTQAVAFIKQEDEEEKNVNPAGEFKIENYLKEYEKRTKELLDYPFPDDCDDKYSRTTFQTLKISINNIKKHGEQAFEILDIIAYFAPDNIPTKIFLKLGKDYEYKLKKDVQLLKKYSMVNLREGLLSVHSLVQQVIRLNLKFERKEEETLRKALELVKGCHSDNKKDNLGKCHFYLLTNDVALSYIERHITYIWSYASVYGKLIKDFYCTYGKNENSPIHLLAICGKKEAMKFILENIEAGKIEKLSECNKYGYAPIHSAAFNGHREIVKYFIEEQNVDVNFTSDTKITPLFAASLGEQLEVMQYLLDKRDADPNMGDGFMGFPIFCAGLLGKLYVMKCLIFYRANINLKEKSVGNNVLHFTILHLNLCENCPVVEEILKCVLEKSPFLTKDANFFRMTALHYAAQFNSARVVELLIDYHADVNAKSHSAVIMNKTGNSIYRSCSVNNYDKGYTPLHIAADKNNLDNVKVLLKKGAIYNDFNDGWKTPLEIAKNKSEVKILLKSIDQSFEAIQNGKKNKLDDLLKVKDSDVLKSILNARNRDKRTLLQVAICYKQEDIKVLLMEKLRVI